MLGVAQTDSFARPSGGTLSEWRLAKIGNVIILMGVADELTSSDERDDN